MFCQILSLVNLFYDQLFPEQNWILIRHLLFVVYKYCLSPLIGWKNVSVCVCQSQPWKHRKLQTSHRLMHCMRDKTCNESFTEKYIMRCLYSKVYSSIQNTLTCYFLRWYICMTWHTLVEIAHFRKMLFRWNNCRCYSRDNRAVKISFHTLQAFDQTLRGLCKVKWQPTQPSPTSLLHKITNTW